MNNIKKIIAALMMVAVVFSFTACSNPSWAFKDGDAEVTSGIYIAFTIQAYINAAQHEDINQDEKDMFKQTLDEKDAKTWIMDEAAKFAKNYLAVEKKYKELNLSFAEKDINIIDTNLKSTWDQMGDLYEDNGVSKASYRKIIENQRKNYLIFLSMYGKGGTQEITDENLTIHFKENFADINVFTMALKTGENLSDDDKKKNEEIKAKADEYIKMINEGKAFNVVSDLYTHYSKDTKHEDTDEHKAEIKEDKETRTLVRKDATQPSEKVIKSIFEAKIGVATLIADDSAYYVVYRYDVTEDKEKFDEMRDSLLYDIKGEDYEKMVDEWTAALSVDTNSAAIKKFNPKNIITD